MEGGKERFERSRGKEGGGRGREMSGKGRGWRY